MISLNHSSDAWGVFFGYQEWDFENMKMRFDGASSRTEKFSLFDKNLGHQTKWVFRRFILRKIQAIKG